MTNAKGTPATGAGRVTNGSGSFRERPSGGWELRFTLDDGTRRSVYGKTKTECRDKRKEVERLHEQGVTALGRSQPLEQFLTQWLKDAKDRLRPRTWDGYESAARTRVIPHIGGVRLNKLTGQQIQALYSTLLEAGLSPASVQRTHALLHRSLKDAVRWGLIPFNPADRVSPPRAVRPDFGTLTAEQVKLLIGSVDDTQRVALYLLAVSTGLRQGEQLGLKWEDIHLDRRVLSVRRSLQWTKGSGLTLDEVKTSRSRRSVALSELAITALQKASTAQKAARMKAGPTWEDWGLVFTNDIGRPLTPQRVTKQLQADLAAAGLPRVRYHDLRHTAATLLLEAGTHPKVVQEMLGHATIAVTMDTYSHVLPHMQEQAASVFDRALAT